MQLSAERHTRAAGCAPAWPVRGVPAAAACGHTRTVGASEVVAIEWGHLSDDAARSRSPSLR
jgi:hypothetical protein